MADRNNWFVITAQDEGEYDTFRRISRAGTAALYSINAMDKAKAVPFVKLWQVDRDSNAQIGPTLSDQFTQLPQFGKSLGKMFGERPEVSLDSVNIKSVNPGGWILYREVDIELTVHNISALNSLTDTGKVLSALMRPNNTFNMKYGWVGGSNSVLGPGYNTEEKEPEYTPEEKQKVDEWRKQNLPSEQKTHPAPNGQRGSPPTPEPKFYKTIFPARRNLRFVVTHYNFSVMPDNQLKFHIHGIEDAELQIRSANIFNQGDGFPKAPPDLDKAEDFLRQVAAYFTSQLKEMSFSVTVDVEKSEGDKKTTQQTPMTFIELQDVLNILFAVPLEKAVNQLGYKHVHLYTGVFNAKCPDTHSGYGGQKWANFPVGQFWLRLQDVQDILNQVVTSRGNITVYNLLKQIVGLISDPGIWKDNKDIAVSVPEMQIYTLFNPETGYARIQVVDRKRYLTLVGSSEHTSAADKKWIQQNLSLWLQANYIPYLTLFHQSSFFKDAKFEVVNDELMKSIFMQRAIRQSREQLAAGDQGKNTTNAGVSQALLLYRSAIKGSLTMIGNFVFDLFGLLWMNFNVPAFNGLFYVLQKTDKISRDGFETTVTLQAEGSDPLGTGIEMAKQLATDPNAVRRNQPQVAEDAIRQLILDASQARAAQATKPVPGNDQQAVAAQQQVEDAQAKQQAQEQGSDPKPFPDTQD